MKKPYILIFFPLFLCCLQGCLGPVVGERSHNSTELQWNIEENQLLQGDVLLKVNVPHLEDAKEGEISSKLFIQGKEVVDEDLDPWTITYLLQTKSANWKEGRAAMQLVVTGPEGEKNYNRNAIINNVTFNQQSFLDRGALGVLTAADDQSWSNGELQKIGDINQDGYEDVLVLDGYRPYIRLGNPDMSKNYTSVWEVSDEDWFSATTCDVNDDGFLDVVVGNPKNYDYKGNIKVFFGPMTASKTFTGGMKELVGTTSNRITGSYTLYGHVAYYDYVLNDGFGGKVMCLKNGGSNSIIHFSNESKVDYLNNGANDFTFPNLKYMKTSNLIGGDWVNSNIEILNNANFPVNLSTIHSMKNSGIVDINNDNYQDFVMSKISQNSAAFGNILQTKSYSKIFYGKSDGGFLQSDVFESHSADTGDCLVEPVSFALGDVNKDGFGDFAVSYLFSPNNASLPNPNNYVPKVLVYFGAKSFPGQMLEIYHPTNQSKTTRFGEKVVSGDFNGDGYKDLAISSPGYEVGTHPEGEVFVYYGPSFSTYERIKSKFGANNSWFGAYMTSFDVNNDGRDDLMASLWGSAISGPGWLGQLEMVYDQD